MARNIAQAGQSGTINRIAPSGLAWLCRLGLCTAFLFSGVSKLLDFQGAMAEQVHFGLSPPALFAAATIATQLGGSVLMLFARGLPAMLAALALAAFTLLASVLGHPFWREAGADRFADLNSFLEHFGLIGGFVLSALDDRGAPFAGHDSARKI